MFNEALLSFAVRSCVALLVTAAIAFFVRRRSASLRHHVWTLGLLGCLIIPILGIAAPAWHLPLYPVVNDFTRIAEQTKDASRNTNVKAPPKDAAPDEAAKPAKQNRATDHTGRQPIGDHLALSPMTPRGTVSEFSGSFENQSVVGEGPEAAIHTDSLNSPSKAMLLTRLKQIMGWVWLSILSVLGVRLILRWFRVRRMLSACEPIVGDRLDDILDEICNVLNIGRRPILLSTCDTASPLIAGVFKPALVLPETAVQWTETELRMVFTHELAHVARHDIAIQSLGDCACVVNWFNPLAWFASIQMRSLREIACDDLVIMRFRQPANYADLLMKIAKACRQQVPAMTVSMARMNSISQRLLSIVDGSRERCPMNRGTACWSVAVAMMLIGMLSVVKLTATAQTQTVTEQERSTQTTDAPVSDDLDQAKDVKTMRVRIVGADGKPIAKASLFVNIFDIERSGDFPNVTLETDEQGEVDFTLPEKLGLLRLWPSKPGYVPQFLNFGNGNQDEIESLPGSQTFYLERGARLSGTIVDPSGQPIADASVQVRVDVPEIQVQGDSEPIISTWLASGEDAVITDQDGRWQILNAPSRKDGSDYKFRLQVTHPEYAGDTRWGELQAIQGVTTDQLRAGTAQIKLDPGLRIRGKITGPDGAPVTQGLVIWDDRPYWAEGDNEVSIDQSGTYRSLPLSPGEYPVTVVAPGYAPQQVKFDLDLMSTDLNFRLKAGNPLVLKIVDQDGQPVPDVSVGIDQWRGTEAIYNHKHPNVPESGIPRKSDSNGIYRWGWAPEDAVVYHLGKKGFVVEEVALVARKKPHRIELLPQMKIYGTVTNKQTGEPIKEFSVVPVTAFRPDFYSTRFQDRLQAKDGEFEIPVKTFGNTGRRYMVRIEAEGYRTALSKKSMELGDAPLREDFQLEPAPPIEAEVENPDGTRAFDFTVAVGTPTSAPEFQIEGPDTYFGIAMKITGTSRFELPATFEPQLVRVFNELGFAEIDLPSDGALGKIQLQPWAKVTGRLMQGDKPIPNEGVYFRPLVRRGLTEARFQDSFYTRTDPEGNFKFDRLPPMAGRIQAYLGPWEDSPMTSSQSIALNLKPGETRNLTLGSEGSRVTGKVIATGRDNDGFSKQWSINYLVSRKPGQPLPEDTQSLDIAAEQWVDKSMLQNDDFSTWLGTKLHYYVKLSEDGRLRIDGVPQGQYDLVIQLYEQPAGCLVETIGQQIIPVAVDSGSSTMDLAEIKVECRSGPRVGSDMRAFKFIDAESRERNVDEMNGQYVLFHVWASWCAPCIASMPNVKSAASNYEEKPLTIVGLNVDEAVQQAKAKSLAEDGSWYWAMNYLGSDSAMMRQLAVSTVPAYYLVGPDGKLVMSSNEWTDVQKAIDAEFSQ